MPFSPKTLAQTNQSIEQFGCLSRPQKELIVTCFEQSSECHKSLKEAEITQSDESSWYLFIGGVFLGVAGGLILDQQMRHQ